MTTDLTNHWRRQYENRYLGVWDLFDKATKGYRTVTARIDDVNYDEVVGEGGRKSNPAQLRLSGTKGPIPVPMIVSKLSGKSLEAMFGPIPKDWIGKSVTLYANRKRVKGEDAYVLTIRNNVGNKQLREELAGPPPPRLAELDDAGEDALE